MKKRHLLYFFIILIILQSCKQSNITPPYAIVQNSVADSAMVVAANPLAAAVGKDILQKGGNAIDAAIAVQFALAVVYPRAGNIGGGGFMVVRTNDGDYASLDYREKAPLLAHRDMYLDSLGNIIEGLSQESHLAVGVPGTVAGMFKAFDRYSQLKDFKLLIEPAIQLAEKGFKITKKEAERLNEYKTAFLEHNDHPIPFIKDTEWKMGDLLVQKELAHTLRLIRDKGAAGFYKGETAQKIVAEMQTGNGFISMADLEQYQAKWREPITANYKDYQIIAMPPPSSGGIALAQLLKIVEQYPLSQWGFHSRKSIHTMAEAERRVYADRAQHLGDSDFYNVPIDSLLQMDYLQSRMASFDPQKASVSDSILAGNFELGVESFETTHTSIIDTQGNAVSVTTTLNLNYGAKIMVDGAGFFLNNEMDDFSAKPGVPNYFGLVGAEANAVAPQKRMLSSMTPTIIERNDQLFMVLGAPGGSTIITAVFQVFLNVAEFGKPLQEAVEAGRFHHQWLPDQIMVESGSFTPSLQKELQGMGHQLKERKAMAIIKAIQVLPNGKLVGAGDPRNPDDHVAGF